MRGAGVCGGACRALECPSGRRTALQVSGWALAIPILGPEAGPEADPGCWVVPLPWYPPSRTPGTHLPHVHAVLHATSSAVRTAVLRSTKEILGVGNVEGRSGHAEAVSDTVSHLTPLLFGPSLAPARR